MAFPYPFADFSALTPWGNFRRLHDEMNRLFDIPEFDAQGTYPPINIWNDDEKAIAHVEIPGIDPAKLDLTVTGNLFTLSGEREALDLKDGSVRHRQERRAGKFTRTLELPFPIESNAVEAEYKNGILTVTLPRAEQHKPRKIKVN